MQTFESETQAHIRGF